MLLGLTGFSVPMLHDVLKGDLKPLEVIDQPLATDRKYGVAGGDDIAFEEVELEATAHPGASFYDQLYAAIRNSGPLPVEKATSRETIRVLSEARNGTRFPEEVIHLNPQDNRPPNFGILI